MKTVTFEEVVALCTEIEPDLSRSLAWGPAVVPHLHRILDMGDALFAPRAVLLAGIAAGEAGLDVLERGARDPNPVVRTATAYAVRGTSPRAEKVLRQLLGDGVHTVRYRAIGAVVRTGNRRLVPDVQRLAQEDAYPHVRAAAAKALAEQGGKPAS